jgi:hypothetical protein
MSWILWLWVGLVIGAFAGVFAMCLMVMARSVDVDDVTGAPGYVPTDSEAGKAPKA